MEKKITNLLSWKQNLGRKHIFLGTYHTIDLRSWSAQPYIQVQLAANQKITKS